jgi:hypothetical protein
MPNDLPLLRAVAADPIAHAVTAWKALLQAQIPATTDAWERTQIQSGVAACESLLRKLRLRGAEQSGAGRV